MAHSKVDVLEEILDERFSCRAFLPDNVPSEKIEKILTLAQKTASWCNVQPWRVVVTCDAATDRLRNALLEQSRFEPEVPDFPWPLEYRGAHRDRRRESGIALYQSIGIARGDLDGVERQRLENLKLFGAPHVAIVMTDRSLGVYGAIDCGAYTSNFMTVARSLGVASIAQASLAARPSFIRQHFSLPPDQLVVCGISFGFEDPTHPANGFRTTRANYSDSVTFVR